MVLEIGDEFWCLVLLDVEKRKSVSDERIVNNSVEVLRKCPFDISEIWIDVIGKQRVDTIRNDRNIFVLVKKKSERPDEAGGSDDLYENLKAILYGMLLQGIPEYSDAHAFGGIKTEARIRLSAYRELKKFYTYQTYQSTPEITNRYLDNAVTVGERLLCFHQKNNPAGSRLKRGFYALFRAMSENDLECRLHEYVRALESLVIPRDRKLKKDWSKRVHVLSGKNLSIDNLRKCYDARSKVEHMESLKEKMKDFDVELYANELEKLALNCYFRIFFSQCLMKGFENDNMLKKFWELEYEKQAELLGVGEDKTK